MSPIVPFQWLEEPDLLPVAAWAPASAILCVDAAQPWEAVARDDRPADRVVCLCAAGTVTQRYVDPENVRLLQRLVPLIDLHYRDEEGEEPVERLVQVNPARITLIERFADTGTVWIKLGETPHQYDYELTEPGAHEVVLDALRDRMPAGCGV